MLFAALGCDPQRAPPDPMGKAAESAGTAGSGGLNTAATSSATATAGGTGGAPVPGCAQPHCPEVLYGTRQATRRGLEVDDTDVFWCEVTLEEGNVVRAAPKSGVGPIRTLGRWHDFLGTPTLVVDDQYVYWMLPEESGSLLRVDKDGHNPVSTPLPPGPIDGRLQLGPIHDAGDAVIIATRGCSQIMRVAKDGNSLEFWELSLYPNGGGSLGWRRRGTSSTAPTTCTCTGSTLRLARRR